MSDENATSAIATPTTAVDPYANYGGSVAAPTLDPYAAYGGSAAPAQTVDPNLPKMSAAPPPSIWDRVKNAITTGIPAFNSSFEAASHTDTGVLSNGEKPTMQIITPDAAMTTAEKKAHPVLTGVAETAGSLTSAPSVMLMAGTAGLGELGVVGKAVLPRLISAGFSAQALKGAYDQIPEFRKALDAGDTAEAERILTHITLDVGMSALGARHAATGGPAISDTAGDAVTAGKRIASGVSRGAEAVNEVAGKTANKITQAKVPALTDSEIVQRFIKRSDTPAAQHGTPVSIESPLDSATVGKQLGGKDLSQEALDALKLHVGDNIPVGSTAKNRLVTAVEPVVRAINDTASKMNKVVQKAPQFTTSVMQDSVFGEGSLNDQFEALKKNLPASDRIKLSADADSVLEDADKALNSNDPSDVLEYRRQLGRKIDWDSIEKNPSTPSEVQNAARAKVYQQLAGKIHAEIPETVELDKTLQPNLELRSHLVRKVGDRLVDDPHAATVEAQTELKKGQQTVENQLHNERAAKYWKNLKTALITAGIGGTAIGGIEKILENLL